MNPDYYSVLGVPRDCDFATLKSAYDSLAREFDSDQHPTGSHTKFAEISEAYRVLSDPSQRSQYDQTRIPPQTGPSPRDACRDFFDDDDPFDDILGPPKVTGTITCTLEELFHGVTKSQQVTHFVNRWLKKKLVNVTIQPGSKDGEKVVLPGEGDCIYGCPPQDLVLVIKQERHATFERDGDDLIIENRISLWRALTGYTVEVVGIDQEQVVWEIEEIIRPRSEIRLAGKGMARRSGGRGDLIIRFEVLLPKQLSHGQRKVITAIRDAQRQA